MAMPLPSRPRPPRFAALFAVLAMGMALSAGCQSTSLCVGCGTWTAGPPATQPVAKVVRQAGAGLIDESGRPLSLRGVNLGGWLLWEAWEWGGSLNLFKTGGQTQSRILEKMSSVLGVEETARFQQDVFDTFVTERDVAAVAAMGLNAVRVPLNHRAFEPGGRGFEALDRLLAWCEAHHVYVVLDLHAAPGGQSPYFIADPAKPLLWESVERRAQTAALWKAIARRYAKRAVVAGYDLLNEPIPPSGEVLVDVYRQIIASIREVDPNHLVIIEGANFAKDFSMFAAPLDANQAYSFHLYTWFGENAEKALEPWVAMSRAQGVPLWCGEFGENTAEVVSRTLDVFGAQSPALAGWSFWTWKKTLNHYPALNEIKPSKGWLKFIEWAADDRGGAPTPQELRVANAEFLRAAALAATVRHAGLEAALASHARR